MKIFSKLTVSLLALAGASLAHAQYPDQLTLKYAWDFNTGDPDGRGYSLENQADSAGAGTISTASGSGGNERLTSIDGVGRSGAAALSAGALRVNNMSMSASKGITIAFAYQSNAFADAGIFNTDLVGVPASLEIPRSFTSLVFSYNFLTVSPIVGTYSSYNSVIMTVDEVEQAGVTGSLISLFVYNTAGNLVGSDTYFQNEILTMNYFQLGYHLDDEHDKNVLLDNLMIYEGAADSYHHHSIIAAGTLAADPFAAGSALQQLAPEPGTATLSLLALTGLLARRRRKTA